MRKSVNQVDKLYFEIHVLFKQLFPYYIFHIKLVVPLPFMTFI